MNKRKKVILLAGPTASGKSKLAIKLAKYYKGEIINADSMQIYKEFSVLSSRPSKSDAKKGQTSPLWYFFCKKIFFNWRMVDFS